MSTNGQLVADDEDITKAKGGLDFAEIGQTGLQHQHGVLYEDTNRDLIGEQGVATYRAMTRDPIIAAGLLAIDNLVREVDWEFEPRPDSGAEGQRWSDHCSTCIGDMSWSWEDTISSIFTMVPFGWSFNEVVLKRRAGEQPDRPDNPDALPSSDHDDGLVGWRGIYPRSQDSKLRWELDARGNVRGMWQQILGGPATFIPIERAGLFRTSSHKGSPEGVSVLRSAHRPWYFGRRIEEHEGIGIERDLAGLPIAHVPPKMLSSKATPEDKAAITAIKRLLQNVRRNANEGVLFPMEWTSEGKEMYRFELMSSGSRRQFDLDAVLARKNQEKALCMLADWLLLGHTAVGSRALASPKMDLFTTALGTWTKGVAAIFDAHITPRLMRANGVSARLAPRLRPGKVEQVDLEQFAGAWSSLITSGSVTNTPETENWARSQIGAPPIDESDWTQAQSGLVVPAGSKEAA